MESGHTDNDLSVFDKTTGFLVENIFIENSTIRASILGWKSNLGNFKNGYKKVVPGHGMLLAKKKQ